jgi:hypothetical protein
MPGVNQRPRRQSATDAIVDIVQWTSLSAGTLWQSLPAAIPASEQAHVIPPKLLKEAFAVYDDLAFGGRLRKAGISLHFYNGRSCFAPDSKRIFLNLNAGVEELVHEMSHGSVALTGGQSHDHPQSFWQEFDRACASLDQAATAKDSRKEGGADGDNAARRKKQ